MVMGPSTQEKNAIMETSSTVSHAHLHVHCLNAATVSSQKDKPAMMAIFSMGMDALSSASYHFAVMESEMIISNAMEVITVKKIALERT